MDVESGATESGATEIKDEPMDAESLHEGQLEGEQNENSQPETTADSGSTSDPTAQVDTNKDTTRTDATDVPPDQKAKHEEARKAEQAELLNGAAAKTVGKSRKTQEQLKSMSVRSYLDETVVPTLLVGMSELSRGRPERALEWLGKYLLNEQDRQDIAAGIRTVENGAENKAGQGDDDHST